MSRVEILHSIGRANGTYKVTYKRDGVLMVAEGTGTLREAHAAIRWSARQAEAPKAETEESHAWVRANSEGSTV